jgi:hypothetical protein
VLKMILIVLAVLIVILIIAVVVLAIAAGRFGRRGYQRYSGLERQRAAAKQSRDSGVDRLKDAERELLGAQHALIARGDHGDAQAVEALRVRLSTAADRHRYALHGYAPLGDPNPIREAELSELQARDGETIADAQLIRDLTGQMSDAVSDGESPDLTALSTAVDHLIARLDRRKALT